MSRFRLLLFVLLMGFAPKAWAQTPTIAVTQTGQTGAGSLSAAVAYANANPGTRITFAVKTPLPAGRIAYRFDLPASITFSAPTLLDASTQTALTGNTNPQGPEVNIFGSPTISSQVTLRSATVFLAPTITRSGSLIVSVSSFFIWQGGTISGLVQNQGTTQTQFASGVVGKVAGGTIDNRATLTLGEASLVATNISLQRDPANPSRVPCIQNSGKAIVNGGVELSGVADGKFINTGTVEQRGGGITRLLANFNNSGLVEAKGGRLVLGTGGIHTGVLRATAPGHIWVSPRSYGRAILRDGTVLEGNGDGKNSLAGTVRIGYAQIEGDVATKGVVFIADDGSNSPSSIPTLIALDCGQFSGTGVVRWVRGIITGYLQFSTVCAPEFRWEGGYLKGTLNINKGCLLTITNPTNAFDLSGNGIKTLIGGAINNDGDVVFGISGSALVNVFLNLQLSDDKKRIASIINNGTWTMYAGATTRGADGAMLNLGLLQGEGELASISNNGVVSPGGDKIGTLVITDGYSQLDCGVLVIDIFGRTSSDYDKLIVCGCLDADGAIDVRLCTKVFDDDCFPVIEHFGASGTFPAITSPFLAEYNANDVTLVVDASINGATITAPTNGSTVSSLPAIYGQALGGATQAAGGTVQLLLRRISDNTYWTGTSWKAVQTLLPTTFDADGKTWRITGLLPKGADLRDGDYEVCAVAYDCDNVQGATAISRFTVKQVTVTPSGSSSQLSNCGASVSGKITLNFSAPLNASAGNTANYTVTVSGRTLPIQSATLSGTSTVELAVETLTAGSNVTIAYRVQDAQGRAVTGQTTVVVR